MFILRHFAPPISLHPSPIMDFAIFNLWSILKLPQGCFEMLPVNGLSVQQSLFSAVFFSYTLIYSILFFTRIQNGLFFCGISGLWLSKTYRSGKADGHAGGLDRSTVPGVQSVLVCH